MCACTRCTNQKPILPASAPDGETFTLQCQKLHSCKSLNKIQHMHTTCQQLQSQLHLPRYFVFLVIILEYSVSNSFTRGPHDDDNLAAIYNIHTILSRICVQCNCRQLDFHCRSRPSLVTFIVSVIFSEPVAMLSPELAATTTS
jgi:hypothetical protein